MRVAHAKLLPIRLPLVQPVVGAHGIVSARQCTLLRLETDAGLVGFGEASPYPGFGSETTLAARTALARAASDLVGCEVEGAMALDRIRSHCARAAIETALLDLQAQLRAVALCERLSSGSDGQGRGIACNALISGEQPEDVARAVAAAKSRGFSTLKLKVGALTLERDHARVATAREEAGPEALIRLDANQAYRESEAMEAIAAFAPHGVEYLEQPVAAEDIDVMAALRRKSPIPLAADEAAITLEDARRVIAAEAADVIVIKPSAAGGPRSALRIAREARRAGLEVVVTSLIDSAVGVAAALHAAAAIANEGALLACGLATPDLFEFDVASLGAAVDGAMKIPRGPGLGLREDRAALAKCLDVSVAEIECG